MGGIIIDQFTKKIRIQHGENLVNRSQQEGQGDQPFIGF